MPPATAHYYLVSIVRSTRFTERAARWLDRLTRLARHSDITLRVRLISRLGAMLSGDTRHTPRIFYVYPGASALIDTAAC